MKKEEWQKLEEALDARLSSYGNTLYDLSEEQYTEYARKGIHWIANRDRIKRMVSTILTDEFSDLGLDTETVTDKYINSLKDRGFAEETTTDEYKRKTGHDVTEIIPAGDLLIRPTDKLQKKD